MARRSARDTSALRILGVHGVGHHATDLEWQEDWADAIRDGLASWDLATAERATFEFTLYDELFAARPLSAGRIAEALVKLTASGLFHGIADLFRGVPDGARGAERAASEGSLGERARWTAGMVVQWAESRTLRNATAKLLTEHLATLRPHVVFAHSLGSLVAYDTFARLSRGTKAEQALIEGTQLVTFGSQVGNAFVRGALGGRIAPLLAQHWWHLYNRHDDVFTARVKGVGERFRELDTPFDLAGFGDHDAIAYLEHRNTVDGLFGALAGGATHRALDGIAAPALRVSSTGAVVGHTRTPAAGKRSTKRAPKHRALLVGINAYPDPAMKLEGCVNDTFLMSSILQETAFQAEQIRLLLDERATARNILERIDWLLDDAQPGDNRVFYYSGHGAQITGYGLGETADRRDECLVPVDFDWTVERAVLDDQLQSLYSQLPYDTRLVMVLDCCHSGGMTRDGGPRVRGIDPPDDIRHRDLYWNAREQMWQARALRSPNRSLAANAEGADYLGSDGTVHRLGRAITLRSLPDADYDAAREQYGHHGPFLPVIYQACQEKQYAFEYRHGAASYGAFTYSLGQILRERRAKKQPITFESLATVAKAKLERLGYDQTPAFVGPRFLRREKLPW
jgi:hypothetical protein